MAAAAGIAAAAAACAACGVVVLQEHTSPADGIYPLPSTHSVEPPPSPAVSETPWPGLPAVRVHEPEMPMLNSVL